MRIAGAVVLAVVLSYAWWLVALLFLDGQIAFLGVWAVEGALIGLAARVAGRPRWAVGVPLLLILVGGTAAAFPLLGLWFGFHEYAPPAGLVLGALLGMVVIGPAILAYPVAAPSAQPRLRRLSFSALGIGLVVLGLLVAINLAYAGIRQRQLERVRRDVLSAVDDLARTEVLAHSGPVVWQESGWYGWDRYGWDRYGRDRYGPGRYDRIHATGLMSGTKVQLWLDSPRPTRQFGRIGKAEGLEVDGLVISVPQPRELTQREVKDLGVVRPFLVSIGVRPELVSRLYAARASRGRYAASRHGLHYQFEVNFEVNGAWEPGDRWVRIRCRGVRSAASR